MLPTAPAGASGVYRAEESAAVAVAVAVGPAVEGRAGVAATAAWFPWGGREVSARYGGEVSSRGGVDGRIMTTAIGAETLATAGGRGGRGRDFRLEAARLALEVGAMLP